MEERKQPDLILDDILRYVPRFQGKIFVIYLSGHIFEKADIKELIRQIAILQSLSIKIVLVHGCRVQITKQANKMGLAFKEINGLRITNSSLIKIVGQCSLELSHQLMECLSDISQTGIRIKPVIGNFIKAKSMGVISGIDYELTGQVDRVYKNEIISLLDSGYMPVISSLGFDAYGRLYNIRAMEVASKVAVAVQATKILFLLEEDLTWIIGEKDSENDFLTNKETPATGAFGDINSNEILKIIEQQEKNNRITQLQKDRLLYGYQACEGGVDRVHFVNGLIQNALLNEVFTQTGQGLLITGNVYSQIRNAQKKDVPRIEELLQKSNIMGEFQDRDKLDLINQTRDSWVFEIDGKIYAAGALINFAKEKVALIAALVVDPDFRHLGIGKKLVGFFIKIAKKSNILKIVAFTTRAGQFFQEQGFKESKAEGLPESITNKGKNLRKSKIYIRQI